MRQRSARVAVVTTTVLVLAACASGRSEPFRIVPQRPIVQLREEARALSPPGEDGNFRPFDLVDLTTLDPTIRFDIRYAGSNNFLGVPVYEQARAFLQRPAAEALLRAHRNLAAAGYGLLVHDGYRPWHVTKVFWEATPVAQRDFVADPNKGSRHNRGCAVDVTAYELATGAVVVMPSGYDEMNERAAADYGGGSRRARARRDLLRRTMEAEGFTVLENEWWHFDYRDWRLYPIGNVAFSEIGPQGLVGEP